MLREDCKRLARLYPTLRLAANSWVHTEEMENGQESATSFHWRNILSESGLSHSARTQLIAEAKEFFSWLLISLGSKRRRSKISTIGHQFDDLRSLLKWMASMKYSRFNDIEPDEIVNFFSFRVESRRFYSGKKLQARSITGRFQLLKNLHQFYLHRSFGLWFDPGTEVNIERLRAGAPKDKYTFLPEANVLSHLNDATNWIHGPALEFLDAIDQCAKLKNESGGDTLDHENDFKIFRDSIQDEQKLRLCSLLGLPPTTTIGKLLLHGRKETYGACIFIIFYMTGLRVGSLITLSADCITSHTHSDGVSYLYLAGHLLKNQKREHYWIANELVVDAINLLARISQPLRTISGMAELFTSMKGLTILPRSGMDFNVKGARDINDILKYFCHSKLRTNILGTDTRIHAHQGRISFAKFVAARDKSSLGALAGYYGHAHDGITDDGYIGTDIDLNNVLEEEGLNDLIAGLEDLITSPRIGGNGSRDIRENVTYRKKFRGRAHVRAEVDRMIKNGVILAPCNYGYCLYRKTLSACKGSDIGPNVVNREPTTCGDCQNFCITEKLESWWKDRADANEVFLRRTDLSEMTRDIAAARVRQSKDLLRSLEYRKGFADAETKNDGRRGQKVSN